MTDPQALRLGALVDFGSNEDGTHRWARIWPITHANFQRRFAALRSRRFGAALRDARLYQQDEARAVAEHLFRILSGDSDTSIAGAKTDRGGRVVAVELPTPSAWRDAAGQLLTDSLDARLLLLEDDNLLRDVVFAASLPETFKAAEDGPGVAPEPQQLRIDGPGRAFRSRQ